MSSTEGDQHPDPMAADKRVMIIGVVAMIVLVGVGVVSGALFAGSACGDIEPAPMDAPVAAPDLDAVLNTLAVPDGEEALQAAVDELAGTLGTVTGVADVTGATELTGLGGGVAATGRATVALDGAGAEVVAAASFDDPARVVGSGSTLYAVALMNELTGQVDALLPVDAQLAPGTCVDTAVVGDPLAFHLAAGDGELLLVRIDEDGDTPELELRDATVGRRWRAAFDVPMGPPGILAERITAAMDRELVVAGRRTIPGEEPAAVIAVDRRDGQTVWELDADALVDAAAVDGPVWVTVREVDDDGVVVAVSPDTDGVVNDGAVREVWLVLDREDGAVRDVGEPLDESPGAAWALPSGIEVIDVHRAADATSVLLDVAGQAEVVVTFAAA